MPRKDPSDPAGKTGGWPAILSAIKSPLGVIALVVLVANAVLAIGITRATGSDFTGVLIGTFVLLGGALIALVLLYRGQSARARASAAPVEMRFDVFLSAPMAALADDSAYQKSRAEMLALAEAFRERCGFRTLFYAGQDIKTAKAWDQADQSVKDDFDALLASRYFVMIYPEKLVSGVLVEAGAALALEKPSLYFVRDRAHLPYILRQTEQAFPSLVHLYTYAAPEDIVQIVEKHGLKLFPAGT